MTGPVLTLLIGLVAATFASVGLAGASGYLAVMSLGGVPAEQMKPAALALNALVALIGTARFGRSGPEARRLLGPILLPTIPASYLGGAIQLPARVYLPAVGVLLLLAAWRLFLPPGDRPGPASGDGPPRRPGLPAVVGLGGAIGFVSGLTGTGGGILLHPSLQLLGWAGPRASASIVSPYILATSIAGLAGFATADARWPAALPAWAAAAAVGGLGGSWAGRRLMPPGALRRVLALLLVAAGLKLLVPAG